MTKIIFSFFTFLLIIVTSCGNSTVIAKKFSTTILENEVYPKSFSINKASNEIVYIYSDERTVSLKKGCIDNTSDITLVDTIDTDDRLNSNFGLHRYFFDEEMIEHFFYVDIQKESTKLLKYLRKSKDEKHYTLNTPKIPAGLFDVIMLECKFEIVSYDDDKLKLYSLDFESNLTEIGELKIDDAKLEKLNFYKEKGNYKIIYKDQKGRLYINNYNEADLKLVDTKKIDFNVTQYVVNYDEAVKIVYYKKDYSLNYYDGSKDKLLFGYFSNIFTFDFIVLNEKPVLFISTYAKDVTNNKQYPLAVIFKYGKHWKEEDILYGEIPVTSIKAKRFDNKIYVLSGMGNVTLSTIEDNCFE